VRLGERLGGLDDEVDGVVHGEHARALELLREVVALEELHHHVGRARLERAHVGDLGHVLALDAHGGAGLAQEARARLGVLRELGQQKLHGDAIVERHVPGLDHAPHAALPQHTLDPILPREDAARLHLVDRLLLLAHDRFIRSTARKVATHGALSAASALGGPRGASACAALARLLT
jgi:hypothetical protein